MKIIELLIGDIEKWKRINKPIKEFMEDMKNPKKAFELIIFGIVICLTVIMFMAGLMYIQNSSQYCEFKNQWGIINNNFEQNMSYQWYIVNLENYNEIYILDCNFDFKRFINELNRKVFKE